METADPAVSPDTMDISSEELNDIISSCQIGNDGKPEGDMERIIKGVCKQCGVDIPKYQIKTTEELKDYIRKEADNERWKRVFRDNY